MRCPNQSTYRHRRLCRILSIAGAVLISSIHAGVQAQNPDPRYQTRISDCRHKPPAGRTLAVRITDSKVTMQGYTATRVLTQSADASLLNGGEIVVCTEYGRVEIADSDDGHVHLQIRIEASGEGSDQPTDAAKRVMADTHVHGFINANQGRLMIRVWHSTLGFSTPGGQPAWMSVRLLVPARGLYRVTTEAFHGSVAIRRLSLAGATMRGNVGDKLKGIPGFIGSTELDNVELMGNVDIDNLAGLPGIRAPVPEAMAATAAPILVKARVGTNCELKAVTGGDINIAVLPAPGLGVRALGESNTGRVSINIDGGSPAEAPGESPFSVRGLVSTPGFDAKAVKVNVSAASGAGNVNIVSIPAAPLARPPR